MFLFLLAFILSALGFVVLAILGAPVLAWAYIECCGFRPNDLELGLCYVPYLALSITVALVVFGLLLWWFRPFLGRMTSREPTLLELVVAMLIVLAVFGLFGWQFVRPHADKLVRAERWPANLELRGLSVDARDIQFGRGDTEYAQGAIRFEIVNHFPTRITEATFTLKVTPDKWSRFVVCDLVPGAVRRIERDTDFGNIVFVVAAGDVPGIPKRCRALLYCDRLSVNSRQPVNWGPRPDTAMVIIGDEPSVAIAGFWIDTSGACMDLTQKGMYVAGSISEGPFSAYPNPVWLKYDGKVFSGRFQERAGRQIERTGSISLALNSEHRLAGQWQAEDRQGRVTTGTVQLVRRGPDSWQNRSNLYRQEMFAVFRETR